MKLYTRRQFVAHLSNLTTELEQDHEEHTGVGPDDEMSFEHWLYEVSSLNDNMEEADA